MNDHLTSLLHVSADDGTGPIVIQHPAVVGVRCFERVSDYAYAAPGGARWLSVHDLGARRPDPADLPPGGTVIVFEQISPPAGWLGPAGVDTEGALPCGEAVLSVIMDVDAHPAAIDAFHGWYEEEHLPTLVAVPGIDAARRFHAVAGELGAGGRERFLALYELRSVEVLSTPAWAAASAMTPRTEKVLPHLSWASQLYRAVPSA